LTSKDIGAVLVHLSADCVFDGCKADAYFEDDPVTPKSAYGRSKEEGERVVRQTTPRHLILRSLGLCGAWLQFPQDHVASRA
jgi:dTDP-4-dehydrorhamnose reductase